jgi:hypothetical protein
VIQRGGKGRRLARAPRQNRPPIRRRRGSNVMPVGMTVIARGQCGLQRESGATGGPRAQKYASIGVHHWILSNWGCGLFLFRLSRWASIAGARSLRCDNGHM